MAFLPTARDASACPAAARCSWCRSRSIRRRGSGGSCADPDRGRLVSPSLELATCRATLAPAGATTDYASTAPRWSPCVVGGFDAGQSARRGCSRYLAQIADRLDSPVTVCDPRAEYADAWDVAGVELVTTMPDDTVVAMKLDSDRADRKVVVEAKAVAELLPIHEAQLLTYMRLTKSRVGLLINFNVLVLTHGIRRFVL